MVALHASGAGAVWLGCAGDVAGCPASTSDQKATCIGTPLRPSDGVVAGLRA